MLVRSGLPVTPEHQAIEHAMTQLEMCADLTNAEKNTLAEYVESLEDEMRACIRVANKHGWNGVENSKILAQFLDDALSSHQSYAADMALAAAAIVKHKEKREEAEDEIRTLRGQRQKLRNQLREIQQATALKCAEICKEWDVPLPMEEWKGTKREHGAAVANELGEIIRRHFRVEDPVCHCGIELSKHSPYENHPFTEMEMPRAVLPETCPCACHAGGECERYPTCCNVPTEDH